MLGKQITVVISVVILQFILALAYDIAGADAVTIGVKSGEFRILTYNVKGLPPLYSTGGRDNQKENNGLISPLLNNYALVLVQEDFFYHDALSSATTHLYQSKPSVPSCFNFIFSKLCIFPGDGLARFSEYRLDEQIREEWDDCNGGLFNLDAGADCLGRKGFTLSKTALAPGVWVDIYNLHMDSSSTDGDFKARANQVEQLLDAIFTFSVGQAVIVAGDTNLRLDRTPQDDQLPTNVDIFERLLKGASLSDACTAVDCDSEQIDRVLYRSSKDLELEAVDWTLDERFVNENGEPLSDHPAVAVKFTWKQVVKMVASDM